MVCSHVITNNTRQPSREYFVAIKSQSSRAYRSVNDTLDRRRTNVSHDLRTPLTPIIAYLDILRNKKFNTQEDVNEYLNSSYNLSIKLKKLIDQLFEYTKLSNGEIILDFVEVDICPILNQLI